MKVYGIIPSRFGSSRFPGKPLIDPALVDRLAAKTVVKVVMDRDDAALYFSRAPIPCDRDQSSHPSAFEGGPASLYVRHLGIYAYRGGFLKRYIAEPPCAREQPVIRYKRADE